MCLFLAALQAATPPLAVAAAGDPGESGHFFALSDPPGAYVFVDGQLLGTTPLRSVSLAPGTYRVFFRSRPPDVFEPEPRPARTFTVTAGDSVLIHERLGRLVRVESDPTDATVTASGRVIGRTPLDVRYYPEAGREIRLQLTGHRPRVLDPHRLSEGGVIAVALDPIEAPRARPLVAESSLRRPAVGAFAALAVAVGAAGLAVHFSSKADDAYDRYLDAAVPASQATHFEEANRFDRLSTTSWIAAEAGFVLSLWLFAKPLLRSDAAVSADVSPALGGARLGVRVGF